MLLNRPKLVDHRYAIEGRACKTAHLNIYILDNIGENNASG